MYRYSNSVQYTTILLNKFTNDFPIKILMMHVH